MRSKDIKKILSQVIDNTEKRLYSNHVSDNPNLKFKQFIKDFHNKKDIDQINEASKIFDEEMNIALNDLESNELKAFLNQTKIMIWNSYINAYNMSFLERHKDTLLVIPKVIIYYCMSVALFSLFFNSLLINPVYAFYISGITTVVTFILGLVYNSFTIFLFDKYFYYKLMLIFISVFVIINYTFYKVFEEGIIWIIYFLILEFASRYIEKRLF